MAAKSIQEVMPGLEVVEPVRVSGPGRVGQAEVEYASAKQILTRASGFMDEYDFTLNPYSGCSFRVHVLLCGFLWEDEGAARWVGALGDGEGERVGVDGGGGLVQSASPEEGRGRVDGDGRPGGVS